MDRLITEMMAMRAQTRLHYSYPLVCLLAWPTDQAVP